MKLILLKKQKESPIFLEIVVFITSQKVIWGTTT